MYGCAYLLPKRSAYMEITREMAASPTSVPVMSMPILRSHKAVSRSAVCTSPEPRKATFQPLFCTMSLAARCHTYFWSGRPTVLRYKARTTPQIPARTGSTQGGLSYSRGARLCPTSPLHGISAPWLAPMSAYKPDAALAVARECNSRGDAVRNNSADSECCRSDRECALLVLACGAAHWLQSAA